MPLTYDPKDAVICWPTGEYDAVLAKVEDKTSREKPDGSGGNSMQVLTYRVFDADGREQLVSDYIVVPTGTFKLKQLAIALGRKDEFDAGTFQADGQINVNVRVDLAIEKQDGFDDRNKIRKVLSTSKTAAAPRTSGASSQATPAETARRTAMISYKQASPDENREALAEAWKMAFKAYFPGKTQEVISASEWQQFARDKFVRPTVTPPISEEPQFTEDGIPF